MEVGECVSVSHTSHIIHCPKSYLVVLGNLTIRSVLGGTSIRKTRQRPFGTFLHLSHYGFQEPSDYTSRRLLALSNLEVRINVLGHYVFQFRAQVSHRHDSD